jgi:hypothetical protein
MGKNVKPTRTEEEEEILKLLEEIDEEVKKTKPVTPPKGRRVLRVRKSNDQ